MPSSSLQDSPFRVMLRQMDIRRGKYRGIITKTASALGKDKMVVYSAVVYSDAYNADKIEFLRQKAIIDGDPIAEQIDSAVSKAS